MSNVCILRGAVAVEQAIVNIKGNWGSTIGKRCTLVDMSLLDGLLSVTVIGSLPKNGTHNILLKISTFIPLRTLPCDLDLEHSSWWGCSTWTQGGCPRGESETPFFEWVQDRKRSLETVEEGQAKRQDRQDRSEQVGGALNLIWCLSSAQPGRSDHQRPVDRSLGFYRVFCRVYLKIFHLNAVFESMSLNIFISSFHFQIEQEWQLNPLLK